jgi:hypothetical protein
VRRNITRSCKKLLPGAALVGSKQIFARFHLFGWVITAAVGCLPVVHEETRDLSEFDTFELDYRYCEGLSFKIERERGDAYHFTVRLEGELISERLLERREVNQVKAAFEEVVLMRRFDRDQREEQVWECPKHVRWDEVSTSRALYGGEEFDVEESFMDSVFELMEELRNASP